LRLLETVYLEITKAVHYQPKLNPRLAWSVHPADYVQIVAELKELGRHLMTQKLASFMPAGVLRIAGIRIFADDDAPRIDL
jgi:hypothetical protein